MGKMNNVKKKNNSKGPIFSNREMLLIVLFALGSFLILTAFLNWINLGLHISKRSALTEQLSNQNIQDDKREAMKIKIDNAEKKTASLTRFPKYFFIFILIIEMIFMVQIMREFTRPIKEYSLEETERFRIKSMLLILPTCFINIIYIFLRYYLVVTFFMRFTLFAVSVLMLLFAGFILFGQSLVDMFMPKKAPTLEEFEKLTKEFEDISFK